MTDTARTIELASIPSLPRMLLQAATTRKRPAGEPEFPALTVLARGVRADAAKLAKFRDVCAFGAGDTLPLTYPHVMAFALHMQLMLEPEFPFAPMGAVHVRNRIRQQRALHADESLDFTVRVGSSERVAKGYEVGIITQARVDGELLWDDLSVMLLRNGGTGAGKTGKPATAAPRFERSLQWDLAANLGRRYAAASGDYNPIHLYPLSARLMGFRRQIAHGMWSKSRCVAHLLPAADAGPVTVDVNFKLPIFLPGTVTLLYDSGGDGSRFELRDAAGEKPHLAGTIAPGAGPGTA